MARELIEAAERVTVLTGAGISTESGIPDYRGPQGVWTRNPEREKLSTIDNYVADAEIRKEVWRFRLAHEAWEAEPNDGHRALVDLETAGKLHLLVTQNVDGLHHLAGTSPDRIVEVHGTIREALCLSCGDRMPMEAALDRVRGGEDDPHCRDCGGLLKSATISFGQALIEEDLRRARAGAEACDLFLAIGTSLQVFPVAYLPGIALDAGADLIVINAEPTPYDDAAAVVLRGRIGEVLPGLVADLAGERRHA
ncbi:MAG: Sir2 family NAD-dependent protein deacetylase [Actinobacteria bacterium]|nr:Sir2 family NAD-dependent protein deacetylase [Actinomycetota bacterium]